MPAGVLAIPEGQLLTTNQEARQTIASEIVEEWQSPTAKSDEKHCLLRVSAGSYISLTS